MLLNFCRLNVITILLLGLLAIYVNGQPGRPCTTPNGESTQCISIYNCPILYGALTSKNKDTVRFLRASQCGFDVDPYVCCGTTASYQRTPSVRPTRRQIQGGQSLLPNRQNCGFQVDERVLGGTETTKREFPWMALLQYKKNSGGLTFSCGGVIINKRYILTAAHCVTGQITQRVGQLVNVRLGEWDTRTDEDCDEIGGFRDCIEPAVDYGVEETIPHSDYDDNSRNRYHDIALIRLNRVITTSDTIRPICMPTASERAAPSEILWVAGWGRTEYANNSPVKLKVGLPVTQTSKCSNTFKSASVTLADTQICAGGEVNKDSCSGDSGGPLMKLHERNNQWILEGVVSFGTRCGTQNWPGIYTRVSKYLDWISNNIAP
ncbi:hypothetical protein ILUMI_14313 [Ignelater luminosus]|uniref:CLIP domain-containing serine protease n=1 Tax=Ignelater luminosus TaxID=2038154 RepID=A0A8K0CWV0_IGNLU|nr:hypothetical protein ILUMI_14313 [Ignelater luminosus]